MKSSFRLAGLIALLIARGGSADNASLLKPLDGPKSPYTERMVQVVRDWPAGRNFCQPGNFPLGIQTIGIRTKDRPYYVGWEKCFVIKAPVATVASVIDDVSHYADLFPGNAAVKEVSRKGNELVLEWERKIPVFFVPNIKYEISYVSDSTPDRTVYRFQFKGGERLRFNDGVEVLEPIATADGEQTLVSNYEFYEADYGIGILGINAISAEAVWKENLRGSYLSLLAIRFKAEHPDWDYQKIAEESERALKEINLDRITFDDEGSSLTRNETQTIDAAVPK